MGRGDQLRSHAAAHPAIGPHLPAAMVHHGGRGHEAQHHRQHPDVQRDHEGQQGQQPGRQGRLGRVEGEAGEGAGIAGPVVGGVGPGEDPPVVQQPVRPVVVGVLNHQQQDEADRQPPQRICRRIDVDHRPARFPRLQRDRGGKGIDRRGEQREPDLVRDQLSRGPLAAQAGADALRPAPGQPPDPARDQQVAGPDDQGQPQGGDEHGVDGHGVSLDACAP